MLFKFPRKHKSIEEHLKAGKIYFILLVIEAGVYLELFTCQALSCKCRVNSTLFYCSKTFKGRYYHVSTFQLKISVNPWSKSYYKSETVFQQRILLIFCFQQPLYINRDIIEILFHCISGLSEFLNHYTILNDNSDLNFVLSFSKTCNFIFC